MKKAVLFMVMAFVTVLVYGQDKKVQKFNDETNLIEVTDYHDNGIISQEGTFNLKGELHGEWISYDALGNKMSQGSYENGDKSGKWLFWSNNTMKEVEYSKNQIASINGIKNTTRLADKN
ncbi:nicotinic acid mononucleotide adenyltransferase [uncultured Eudoraea sp.]|uniref:toxin-antitoxin system YwqK family antitoxin n=1 Tax=uncultured Eudoraea sp. TaxID=1035614 RepID=UPI0026320EAA|nr:nicotinic acid mononucleotide adenyltransferase [uncultured Eudoraea sp.]